MQPINSLQDYKALIQWNKNRLPQVTTNCMAMASSFDRFIQEKRLYATTEEDGLAIWIDEGKYYNLFYHWKADASLPDLRREKPVVVEILNNNGSRDAYIEEIGGLLRSAGFTKCRKNLQVSADFRQERASIQEMYDTRVKALAEMGFSVAPCEDEETFRQVVKLWEEYLEITDVPNDHFSLKDDFRILNIYDEQKCLAATTWWSTTGKSSEGRHVVTAPGYYKKGLATTLLLGWIVETLGSDTNRWTTWINENNFRSLGLFGKVGFRVNNKVSVQYILN